MLPLFSLSLSFLRPSAIKESWFASFSLISPKLWGYPLDARLQIFPEPRASARRVYLRHANLRHATPHVIHTSARPSVDRPSLF